MSTTVYDFAIIGAGAAGLQLGLAMLEDPWFQEKTILILEKEQKDQNDKTWCYWEKGSGKWDSIVHKSWINGYFINSQTQLELNLDPYSYKMLHALDFYEFAKSKLLDDHRINWFLAEVNEVNQDEIRTGLETYHAKLIFDSRIDPDYMVGKDRYLNILQHFRGWYIKTEKPVFDQNSFVMMDYRLKYEDQTCFIYVLPVSNHEALIEYTFFTPDLVKESVYDEYLGRYISDYLNIEEYEIQRVEKGVIPMTNYPFHRHSKNNITKIGTAGSWVKPSSGYSFRNSGRMVEKLIGNLKNGKDPSEGLINKKFRYYDTLFLDILCRANHKGEKLFTTLYTQNSIQDIMRFLDEESTFFTDLKIMASFPPAPFFKSIFRNIF